MTALDFDGLWPRVRQHLADATVERALNAGMSAWCVSHGTFWDAAHGPWYYSEENLPTTPPSPDGPDWYRCWGACHWLGAWQAALGQCMFPELNWVVALSHDHQHTAAIGLSRDTQVRMTADILTKSPERYAGATPEEILRQQALQTLARIGNSMLVSIEAAITFLETSAPSVDARRT